MSDVFARVAHLTQIDGVREDSEDILAEVYEECRSQVKKWGVQNHPDGTGTEFEMHAENWRDACDAAFKAGEGTWKHVLLEEVFEALAESDPEKLRTELIQVAAVCASWVAAIDRRDVVRE